MAHDVFISYSTKDNTIADAVCARLEVRNIRCWIAPRDVQPGFPYAEEIIDAIHGCKAMVLILSANANASLHIPKEIERAVSRGVPVIPLRIEDVVPERSLDYFLSSVHWLDAITPPLEEHVDSLANTIRTLLPDGTPATGLKPDQTSRPSSNIPKRPDVLPEIRSGKPKLLLPGIVIVAALLIAAWFIWGRTESESPRKVIITTTQPEASVQPERRAITKPKSPDEPIAGCWRWFNNASVVINRDGGVVTGPFVAHWDAVDSAHHIYAITWPEAVDTIALSPDGRTLGGGNQYGIPMSASRLSLGTGLPGSWRWYNGVTVQIREDGTFTAAHLSGTWQTTGAGTFTMTWPNPVDTLSLSSDYRRLNGSNQYGFHISGTKTGPC